MDIVGSPLLQFQRALFDVLGIGPLYTYWLRKRSAVILSFIKVFSPVLSITPTNTTSMTSLSFQKSLSEHSHCVITAPKLVCKMYVWVNI